jgi:hypothetical protein
MKSSLAEDAAAAYEALRSHLVDPANQPGAANGRAILFRRGMLAWASEHRQALAPVSLRPRAESPVPSAVGVELVQIMAGLILGQRKGSMLCLT